MSPTQSTPKSRWWHRSPGKWFVSLPVGIVLLVLVTIASIAGTMIYPLERALKLVYHTWWFEALLLTMAINMGCATWRTIVEKTLPSLRARFLKSPALYSTREASLSVRFDGAAQDVASALAARGFKTQIEGEYGYACKGRFSRWGAPVAHAGIVIVLLGGFASRWMANEGVVMLAEGEETQSMISKEALEALRAGSKENPPMIPLGYHLRCDEFETGFFPKTTLPSKYISTLTSLDADPPIRSARLEVNNAVTINGWTLHQTSCQETPGETRFLVEIRESGAASPAPISIKISPGQKRLLPGKGNRELRLDTQYPYSWQIMENEGGADRLLGAGALYPNAAGRHVRIERFEPDFIRGEGGKIKSRSRELNNPAIQIALSDGNSPIQRQWLFAREELKQAMRRPLGGYFFEFAATSGHDPDWQFHITANRADGEVDDEPQPPPPLAPRPRAASSASTALIELTLALGDEAPLGAAPAATDENSANQWRVRRVKNVMAYVTTITLTRNRALSVIYAGCILMMAGLMIAYLLQRKEVWFQASQSEKTLRITGKYSFASQTLDSATLKALGELQIGARNELEPSA